MKYDLDYPDDPAFVKEVNFLLASTFISAFLLAMLLVIGPVYWDNVSRDKAIQKRSVEHIEKLAK